MSAGDGMRRREFLRSCAAGIAAAGGGAAGLVPAAARAAGGGDGAVKARYWKALGDKAVGCTLCARGCAVPDGERGHCRVRENRGGTYYTLVHSRVCSLNNDPIEKKPLFHYRPATLTLSTATAGCNFSCTFCQNWEISQFAPEEVVSTKLGPAAFVEKALAGGSASVAFTYSEPTVFYEYAFDCARAAREKGLGAVMISNGYIRKEPLAALLEHVDGYKIDFKSFGESFYADMCGGHLKPVLKTLVNLKKSGVWFELVNLVIPTLNDDAALVKSMCRWIAQELGDDVPIHFTRFHPVYKLTGLPQTPVKTLERCRDIAREAGLHFVYVGNAPGHEGENTYCPTSGKPVIERIGFKVVSNKLVDGKCPCCGTALPGKWS